MVLSLLFLACIKPAGPVLRGADRPITVVGVVDAAGDVPAVDTPASFDEALLAAARERRLAPHLEESPAVIGAFTDKRQTGQRVSALGAESTLLVETAPVFYSELSGQYRWTVAVKATLSVDGAPIQTATFDVPVFLRYHHQREADAVEAAAPVISRRVGELLDGWLRSGG